MKAKKKSTDGKKNVELLISQMNYVLTHYDITKEELASAISLLNNWKEQSKKSDSALGKQMLLQFIQNVLSKKNLTQKDINEGITYLKKWGESRFSNKDSNSKIKEKDVKLSQIPIVEQKGTTWNIVQDGGEIEDTIFNTGLPVNSIVALNRMLDLLKENKTNNLESAKKDIRVQKLMWLLNAMYGNQDQAEWKRLYAIKTDKNKK